jgi:ribokinase
MSVTSSADASPGVAVVGSLNLDLVVQVPHHPRPGETVLGSSETRHPGGKGANQAVAAARLGQQVAMIGCVGNDASGRYLASALAEAGVDVAAVGVSDTHPTGVAYITVDDTGENTIVVSQGANLTLTPAAIATSSDVLAAAAVTLLQLEVPLDAVAAAATTATGTVVLNPAPATELPESLRAHVDVLVPNESELALLAGAAEADVRPDIATMTTRARSIAGPGVVVVTMGGDGALIAAATTATHVPAHPVEPVDTTAAGDSFCGALADALARGRGLGDAVRWATRAAAITVTRPGAQPALPTRAELEGVSLS